MSLVKWNQARDLATLPSSLFEMQRDINRMFNSFFNSDRTEDYTMSSWYPVVDIAEQDDQYLVRMELPGVSKDDVKITIESNVLTVKGEKKQEQETKKENYHRIERSYGSFQRSFTLPTTVKNDKIDAIYKDGVLNISLPKAEEAKPKQIEVKVK